MAEAKQLAADVRPFKGFIAIDGSTHNTQKQAIDHSTELKVRAAVTELAMTILEVRANARTETGPELHISSAEQLAEILLCNRTTIQSAFNQQVRLRAPGGGRPRKQRPTVAVLPADVNPAIRELGFGA